MTSALKLTPQEQLAASSLREKFAKLTMPDTMVVLGSGFKSLTQKLNIESKVAMSTVEGLPTPKVGGHGSDFVLANVASKRCLIQTGRVHLYEGYTALEVCRTIRVAASLGVKNLIVTNAAGSLRKNFEPGEVVAIHDHCNMSGQNPLTGLDASEGQTFVDMVNAYDEKWRDEVMLKTGIKKAAYLGLPGPNYETPFEVRMFAGLGADLVGMSTVCEVIAARHLGLKVFGLSLVTNFAAGLSQKLSHTEVLQQGAASAETAVYILEQAITSAPVAAR